MNLNSSETKRKKRKNDRAQITQKIKSIKNSPAAENFRRRDRFLRLSLSYSLTRLFHPCFHAYYRLNSCSLQSQNINNRRHSYNILPRRISCRIRIKTYTNRHTRLWERESRFRQAFRQTYRRTLLRPFREERFLQK